MAEGRGRLSSIDLLPEEAQDDILWALSELNQRKRTQADILFELNDRLQAKGLDPVSRGAFNRHSTKLAARSRRIAERQAIYSAIAPALTPEKVAETDLVLGEFLKTLIDELLDDQALDAKGAHDLAKAFHHTVNALKASTEHKARLMKELDTKTEKVIDAVAKEGGLSADVIAQLRRDFLGVRPVQPEPVPSEAPSDGG
ncbi:hypothetical protein CCR97_04165 [Rhodoplanes elegans]|uniref:DUF3486 domain-containing protein n=1 Tax=Rhodoplanes elegans TaxID=29408 RepID=A0A327KM02_9BRAD|nr:DUF3486 family protein [Rhodoplanes elegans]MBK5957404.1 hypothetical protein [Rhodoplanes elegans]RAI39527.1 hypothetical protein CH338_09140 [Rhodoplanes elegans]